MISPKSSTQKSTMSALNDFDSAVSYGMHSIRYKSREKTIQRFVPRSEFSSFTSLLSCYTYIRHVERERDDHLYTTVVLHLRQRFVSPPLIVL